MQHEATDLHMRVIELSTKYPSSLGVEEVQHNCKQTEIFRSTYWHAVLCESHCKVDFAADRVQRDWSLARRWNVLCSGVEG